MKIKLCIVLTMVIAATGRTIASDTETKQDAISLLTSRGWTNTQTWGEAHMTAVVGEIRAFANSKDADLRLKALTTLVNIGDTNAVNDLVLDFSKAKLKHLIRFQRELEKRCTQPALILQLELCLNLDEDTRFQLVDHEFLVEPRSVAAAGIIRAIITKSEQFHKDTKTWAANIDKSNAQALRTEIRRWCKENRAHLVSREFDKAMPPTQ
jgi:hypothetical protein